MNFGPQSSFGFGSTGGGGGGSVAWTAITGKPSTTQFMWVVGGAANFVSPVPPGNGATTLTTALLAGFLVRVSRGGQWQLGINPLSGNTYYTKNLADNFVTFSQALSTGEEIIVETIPL